MPTKKSRRKETETLDKVSEGEVPAATSRLQELAGNSELLIEDISRLKVRLDPILTPMDGEDEVEAGMPVPSKGSSLLSQHVDAIHARVYVARMWIRQVEQRLEI